MSSDAIINLLISLTITLTLYMLVPLLIVSRVYKKTKLVKYKQIIIINAIVMFILLSIIHYYLEDGVANPTTAVLWSIVTYFICKKKYGRNAVKCPSCGQLTNTDPCEKCNSSIKQPPTTPAKRPSNVILVLDKNNVETDWVSFEVLFDGGPFNVSFLKPTKLITPIGSHIISYSFKRRNVPVLKFDVTDLNEIITITCSLVDKDHISAAITSREIRTTLTPES